MLWLLFLQSQILHLVLLLLLLLLSLLLVITINRPTGRLNCLTHKSTVQSIQLADSHCHLVSRLDQRTLPSTIRSVYPLLVDPNRLANFSHQEGQYPNSLVQSDENSNQGHVGRLHIFGICTMVEIGEESLDIEILRQTVQRNKCIVKPTREMQISRSNRLHDI